MPNRHILAFLLIFFLFPTVVFAGPSSSNFELEDYSFGSGGTEGASSANFGVEAILGEVDFGAPLSANFEAKSGLVYTQTANVPATPTLTNPATNYDRLKFIIDNGNNPTDAEYMIAITDDNWTTTKYVQDDNTIGNTLGVEDWQSYSNWGGTTGEFVTNLLPGTEYKIKVKARQGNFTESEFSAEATESTSNPSLTFGISSNSLAFEKLNASNSYTDSTKYTDLTTTTNAYNGYTVYARETGALSNGTSSINDYGSANSNPSNWTGTGFGYTTDDSSLTGGTATRFTSGGPNYAGFVTSAPGDPVADHVGPVVDPSIIGETFRVSYRVTASESTPAGSYTNTIVFVVVPVY